MAPSPLSPDAERRLAEAVLAGEPGAFVRLVRQYERLVAHVVYALVPGEADRADLCQDVFVRVYEHLAGFRFEARLSTWIARIATTTCLKHAEKRRPALLDDLEGDEGPAESPLGRVPSGEAPPDVAAGEALRAEAVHAAVARLPAAYRVAITLFHLEDLSYDEVAEATGLPLGTVKSHLFRARRLLKEQLLATRRAAEWI